MARYGSSSANPEKSAKAKGSYLRVSFKNTRETAQAINGWELQKAKKYLAQVVNHERAIPFRRFNSSIGRTAQGKEFGVTKARWPVKSVKFIQELLANAESNADVSIRVPFSGKSLHEQINLCNEGAFIKREVLTQWSRIIVGGEVMARSDLAHCGFPGLLART